MRVIATIERIPVADAEGGQVAEASELDEREGFARIVVEADSYEEGKVLIDEQLPEGWRLVNYRVPG